MTIIPYIHFQGNCAEAMQFYAEVFGGRVNILRYRDMPDPPAEFKDSDLVMNAALQDTTEELMASDNPPGYDGPPQAGISLAHIAPDLGAARRVFDQLAAGGEELMAFGPTFWSPGFGMLKDRFGTQWMIYVPRQG